MSYGKQISVLVGRAARAGAMRSWAGAKEDAKEERRQAAAELKAVREAFAELIEEAEIAAGEDAADAIKDDAELDHFLAHPFSSARTAEAHAEAQRQADFDIQEAAELEDLANTQAANDLTPEADK